jgi:putative transcriptional regulator
MVVNLDVTLARRKLSLDDVSQAVSVSIRNLSALKTGKARAIRVPTLDALLPRARLPARRPARVRQPGGSTDHAGRLNARPASTPQNLRRG